MWIPNATNTATVPMAMAADSCAAQRLHRNTPQPATTYAKPAMKLNQSTKGTMFPAAARCAGPPNKVFPPTMIVTMPNATATTAATAAQRGREDIVPVTAASRLRHSQKPREAAARLQQVCNGVFIEGSKKGVEGLVKRPPQHAGRRDDALAVVILEALDEH